MNLLEKQKQDRKKRHDLDIAVERLDQMLTALERESYYGFLFSRLVGKTPTSLANHATTSPDRGYAGAQCNGIDPTTNRVPHYPTATPTR